MDVAGPAGSAPCFEPLRDSDDGALWSELAAIGAALAVGACILGSSTKAALPLIGWAAAFVVLAVERDVRERRIPNWLTFPALGIALAHAAWTGGALAASTSLIGAVSALVLLVLPYRWGWFGAGDVKALMVLGALWGAALLVSVLTWAILLGGILALAWITLRGALPDLLTRCWTSLSLSLASRSWTYLSAAPGSAAARGIPFAIPIGLAVTAFQLWGSPWS